MEQNQSKSEKPRLGKAWDFSDKFFRFIGWNFITGAMILATKNAKSDSSAIAFAFTSLFMLIIISLAVTSVLEYAQSYIPNTNKKIVNFLLALVITAVVQLGSVLVIATAISAVILKH